MSGLLLTEGSAPSTPSAGKVEVYAKTDGRVYSKDDAGLETAFAGITSGTSVTASGTSVDFTGIPSGVKRITIMFSGVSTNGTSNPLIQLGTSGGVEASSYTGAGSFVGATTSGTNFTTGFGLTGVLAANVYHGVLTLVNVSGNIWAASGVFGGSNSAFNYLSAGSKTLAGTLDRVRITTVNGTDTFDAGTINIIYE